MLGSFKLKLVGTFLALSVLPLAAAFWGFSQVAERSVTSSTDDRLEAGLSAALVAFEDERRRAGSAAERLGRDPAFQAAVASGDRAAIARLLPASPSLRVEMPGGPTIGVGPAARRRDGRLAPRPRRPLRHDRRLGAADGDARAEAARSVRPHGAGRARDRALRRRHRGVVQSVGAGRGGSRPRPGRDEDDRRPQLSRDRRAPRAGERSRARGAHAELRHRRRASAR